MSQLVIEGMTVRVAEGTGLDDTKWGDFGRAFSGKARSDYRADHRIFRVRTAELDVTDALALRLLLQSPGALSCSGDQIGSTTTDFHARNVRYQAITATDAFLTFELHETDDQPAVLLFSFDGDAPGTSTFTRTGTALAANAAGYLTSVAANTLRRPYLHPWSLSTTRAGLIEKASQNEIIQSEDLNTTWVKTNLTGVTTNQGMGPDGATSLDEIVEDATASVDHDVRQALTGLTADAYYAFSGFFIKNNRGWVRLKMFETAASANYVEGWVNLTTGAVGTLQAGGTGAALRIYVEDWTDVVGGLYRAVVVGSIGNSATAVTGQVALATGDTVTSYNGDGSSSIYGGYIQLEDNAVVASSYIPTTTVAVARNVEMWYADIDWTPESIAAAGGVTFYIKGIELGNLAAGMGARLLHIGSATAATDPRLDVYDNGSGFYAATYDDGTTVVTATVAAAPTLQQAFELRVVLNADGSLTIGQSVASGTETTASDATTATMPAAWAGARAYIGSAGSTLHGACAAITVRAVLGVRTMAQMRNFASARLHRRVA